MTIEIKAGDKTLTLTQKDATLVGKTLALSRLKDIVIGATTPTATPEEVRLIEISRFFREAAAEEKAGKP